MKSTKARKRPTLTTTESPPLNVLYEQDETAWLEAMSTLAAQGRHAELDHPNLSEYLSDLAKRDRREVSSRLVALIAHLLKWEYQPLQRTGSWRVSIMEQRRELRKLLESRILHNYAKSVLTEAYTDAQKQAAVETALPRGTFPAECPWDLEKLLVDEEDES